MRVHDATEQAYKNGFSAGYEAGRRSMGMKWIPVAERLPDDGEGVLVCVTDRINNVKLERAFLLAQYCFEDGWILEMWPEVEAPNVTHWMPLPAPPEEKGVAGDG